MSVRKQLYQARKKLQRMGIKPYYKIEENKGYLVIDLRDFANLIKKKIQYPNKKVYLDGHLLIIEVWK